MLTFTDAAALTWGEAYDRLNDLLRHMEEDALDRGEWRELSALAWRLSEGGGHAV